MKLLISYENAQHIEKRVIKLLKLFRDNFFSGEIKKCNIIARRVYYYSIKIETIFDGVEDYFYSDSEINSSIVEKSLLLEDRISYYSDIVNIALFSMHERNRVIEILDAVIALAESDSENTCKSFYEEMKRIAFK